MHKVDLHTHSILSYDGGIDERGYEKLLSEGILDCIAITDHNEIDFALAIHKKFGENIIIGEEIKTQEGEIIGLFLVNLIDSGMTARETAKAIHAQSGLVYIPHPFETKRSSIRLEAVKQMADEIDIIEVFNARGFLRGRPSEALKFATDHHIVTAAASDAHGLQGLGQAYTIVSQMPTRDTLRDLLRDEAFQKRYANIFSLLTPRFNVLKRKILP